MERPAGYHAAMEALPTTREDLDARWARLDLPAARARLVDARALADEHVYERNIENYLGTLRVPVGLAGPVRVRGLHADGAYDIPLATTEATLVASYGRGMRAINDAGGCTAAVLDERIERTPAFVLADLPSAAALARWVRDNEAALKDAAERTSRFARCLSIEPIVEGNHLYLACAFHTNEAAGQNMVTIASDALCAFRARTLP